MTNRVLNILLFLIVCFTADAARVYTPADVPNVHLKDARRYVSDPEGFLSDDARRQADATLKAIADSTTSEMAIVLVPSIGDTDIFDFTQKLATDWGVGKSDKDNGLVIVFDMEGHKVRVHPGQGLEGIFTDVACSRLIDEEILPHMREGDTDGAVLAAARRVQQVLSDPAAAEEIRSSQSERMASPFDDVSPAILLIFPAAAALIAYISLLMTLMRLRGMDNFQKALTLHNDSSETVDVILAIFSLGIALPALLIRRRLRKRYRDIPRKCDMCGTEMKKLDEETDNAFLTPAQDLEEKIKSVDYDVWLCPRCGATEIFPFPEKNSGYSPCPACGTHAMRLLYDRVDRPATTHRAGYGTRIYECLYCRHRKEERYNIPQKPVAPIIIGGSGGSSGGGFSGGSFGGGSFGGGGSTGSW